MNDGDRVPPHDLLAERATIGAGMLHNEEIDRARNVITAADFYRSQHAAVWRQMITLRDQGASVDFVTLRHALTNSGELEDVDTPGKTPTPQPHYKPQLIERLWELRKEPHHMVV